MIVLVPEEKWILDYVAEPAPKVADYIKGITKPTTVIYDHAKNLVEDRNSSILDIDKNVSSTIKSKDFPISYLPVVNNENKAVGIITFVNLIKGEV